MKLFKNSHGSVRSGWIILLCLVLIYGLSYGLSWGLIEALAAVLRRTGDIDPVTGFRSPLVDWLNGTFLPIALQLLLEAVIIAVVLLAWKVMRQKWEEMGLRNFKTRFPRDGVVGMALGVVCCSVIFIILLLSGNAIVAPVQIRFTSEWFWWIVVFIFVGIGEELMNRGLIMSLLRRTNNVCLILVVPSIIFGLIHIINPGVTFLSILNIVLIGIVFSWMYYKSGNLWMCIGYHITWNIIQSLVYGMPASGLTGMDSLLSTHFPTDNLLNGGSFGIEGGLLTTFINLALLAFVHYYYRNSEYRFLPQDKTLAE